MNRSRTPEIEYEMPKSSNEFDGNVESRYLPSVVIGVLKIAVTSEQEILSQYGN